MNQESITVLVNQFMNELHATEIIKNFTDMSLIYERTGSISVKEIFDVRNAYVKVVKLMRDYLMILSSIKLIAYPEESSVASNEVVLPLGKTIRQECCSRVNLIDADCNPPEQRYVPYGNFDHFVWEQLCLDKKNVIFQVLRHFRWSLS